jgi:flagellar biosynthesis chaperone FliJ
MSQKPPKPPPDRLDRIERAIESLAEEHRALAQEHRALAQEHRAFQATVRGAFTVQQEQIAGLQKIAEAHQQQIDADRARLNQLIEHWQAYLNTIHPKQ